MNVKNKNSKMAMFSKIKKIVVNIKKSWYNRVMTQKEVINLFKRFLIVFLVVGVPIACVFTLAVKLASIYVILITVLIVSAVFVFEEYLLHLKNKKRHERRKKEGKE